MFSRMMSASCDKEGNTALRINPFGSIHSFICEYNRHSFIILKQRKKAPYRPNQSLVIPCISCAAPRSAGATSFSRRPSVAPTAAAETAPRTAISEGTRRRGGKFKTRLEERGGRYPTAISPEKVRPICVITSSIASFFTGIPALLARGAAGFGLQTAPVALLREAFARWPR
jgi:hypothetical protein